MCHVICPVLKKVYHKTVTFMQPKVYRAMQQAQGKMLREYFSGVPVENLSKRYGYAIPKIKQLASEYKQGKIDIFGDVNKRKIAMSMMSHQEEVQMLQDKIRALEHALKMCPVLSQCPVSPLVYLLIWRRFVKFVCYDREYDIDFPSGWSEDRRSGGNT